MNLIGFQGSTFVEVRLRRENDSFVRSGQSDVTVSDKLFALSGAQLLEECHFLFRETIFSNNCVLPRWSETRSLQLGLPRSGYLDWLNNWAYRL